MNQTSLPIIYVDKEELVSFLHSGEETTEGFSYEWENENVTHLHINKPLHSYGLEDRALFKLSSCSEDSSSQDDNHVPAFRYIVHVYKENTNEDFVRIWEICDNKKIERKAYYIPSKDELYSRNKGILEINILEKKRVMIVGLGSFGSQIAIELAKAGVGSFSLFDFDRVELHNLARHTCTTKDLGRLKTDAIYDAIKGKNPYAIVDKFPININDNINLLNEQVAKADIVICGTDNNKSRYNLSEALVKQQKIGIFGRAITRAEGGDVFRYHPGGPCYCCLIGMGMLDAEDEEITDVQSARRDGRIAAYVSEEDADAMVQVGLSADIEPICNLMVKLTLVELSRGKDSGISCLEKELVYDYYMWANRRERRHANWSPMPEAGNQPTILRWYGARINKSDNCPICSKNLQLETGEEIEAQLGDMTELESINLDEL